MDETAPLNPNVQANLNTLPAFMSNVTSQFIVTPTDGPSTIGICGFIFDIIGIEEMTLESDITDHYTEDNTSIQDQIAIRPEQFTLSGYVGELAYNVPNLFTEILTTLQSFINVPGFSPQFSIQSTQTYNQIASVASKVGNVLNQAANIYSLFSGISTTANKQQNAFQYFYNLWLSRQLCEVETPYGVLQNMAILSVRAKQDETTRMVSDFSVTFKAMRFASTSKITSTGANLDSVTGRASQVLKDKPDNSGSTSGVPTNNSTLSQNAQLLNTLQAVN